MVSAYYALGYLHRRAGDAKAAIPHLVKAWELSQRWRFSVWISAICGELGMAFLDTGDAAEARKLAAQVSGELEANNTTFGHVQLLSFLARVSAIDGRREHAQGAMHRALERCQELEELGAEGWIWLQLGDFIIDGNLDNTALADAALAYEKARDRARQYGMRPLEAHSELGLGIVLAHQMQEEQAKEKLNRAVAIFKSIDMQIGVERAERALSSPGPPSS